MGHTKVCRSLTVRRVGRCNNSKNSGLPGNNIIDIMVEGTRIWVVTNSGGLACYETVIGTEENDKCLMPNAKIEIGENPFIKSTAIKYSVPDRAQVSLNIYDLSGRCVRTLVNGEKPAGSYSVNLDAKDLAMGIYFVELKAGSYRGTRKLILMR